MSCLKICGVQVNIRFTFLIFTALIFLVRDGMTLFGFFTVCMLHEFGHGAALKLSGGAIESLTFHGMGIKMQSRRTQLLSAKREALVLIAGPAVNLIMFMILSALSADNEFAAINLAAAVFNLLPYSMLDGGSLLNLAAEQTSSPFFMKTVYNIIRIMISLILLYLMIFLDEGVFPFFAFRFFILSRSLWDENSIAEVRAFENLTFVEIILVYLTYLLICGIIK